MSGIAPITRATAQDLRKSMTPQERKLWGKLRAINRTAGTHFRRQAPVGRFIADFVEFGRKLVIEVDGGGHGGPSDRGRDDWFAGQGFRVMRFWNSDVDSNIEGVMQVVLDEIVPDSPPPHALPQKGEAGRSAPPDRGQTP